MFKNRFLSAALAAIAVHLFKAQRGRPGNLGQRYQSRTQATRRQIDPDPSRSRQQRRYAGRLAAKRERYSDDVRRAYRVPLPA